MLKWVFVYVLRNKVVKGNGWENAGGTVIEGLKFIDIFNQYECERKYRFIMFMLYTSLDRIAQILYCVCKYYILLTISKSFANLKRSRTIVLSNRTIGLVISIPYLLV